MPIIARDLHAVALEGGDGVGRAAEVGQFGVPVHDRSAAGMEGGR